MGGMSRRANEPETERLYQVPPGDFTRERNALAKAVGGEGGKRIRALPKPSTSAWAVNQLYWQDRDTYEDLVSASERLRSAHRVVLAGRKADLVGADAAHRDAVKTALTSTLRLVRNAGQKISAGTHNEIAQTLETLSSQDPAGRLAKPLQPEGFEALQGMPVRAQKEERAPKPARAAPADKVGTKDEGRAVRVEHERERKEAQRKLRIARTRERRDRAALARLQKRVAHAERSTAAAKASFDRAQAAEAKLRTELERAQESLEDSENALRDL
jgi:hypothetical protein